MKKKLPKEIREFFVEQSANLQSANLPKEIREYFVEQGAKGGKKRARRLTAEQRKTIAKRAAAKRWGKKGAE